MGARWGRAFAVVCLSCATATARVETTTVTEFSTGITVQVRSSGYYGVTLSEPANWRFAGRVPGPLTDVMATAGSDAAGSFQEIQFTYSDGAMKQGAIRTYAGKPVVLFTVRYPEGGANEAAFPELTTYPELPFHLAYHSAFGFYSFDSFAWDSPWLFFDPRGNSFLLSPATNFAAATTTQGEERRIRCGIDSNIKTLPRGFEHRTLLAIERGINRAFDTWGRALTDLHGKTRPPNDADVSLARLGYWTDNGATYYYRFEPALGYAGTLLGVRDDFARAGISLGYIQLDSWFYPKGPNADWGDLANGIHEYTADRSLFPQGLRSFQRQLGIPLITHSRWIDARSPYRQRYRISGNVATDALYWDDIAAYLRDSGVATYEQDWLGTKAQAELNLVDRDAFLGNMASACKRNGVTIQYCMPLPRHYLQSVKYDNVTTIRTSQDRFGRSRWDQFLFGSRLAGALGLWPFSDVFLSTEADNLLVATLSAGPVGVGDPIGFLNAANLRRAVRQDGVIVKPDVPLTPLDESILNAAKGLDRPMIASTYTDFETLRASYVFSYSRGSDNIATFIPSSLGVAGPVYVYNYFSGEGRAIESEEEFSEPMTDGRAYYLVVPIGPSGVGFLGDPDQFVSLGKKRIAGFADDGIAEARITFGSGETARKIHGYSPSATLATALKGAVDSESYDGKRKRFSAVVHPDAEGNAVIQIRKK